MGARRQGLSRPASRVSGRVGAWLGKPPFRPCLARGRRRLQPPRNLPARGGRLVPDALLARAARGVRGLGCGHPAAGQGPRRCRALARFGNARTSARLERRARADELSRSTDDRRTDLARVPALGCKRNDGIDPDRLPRHLGERPTAKVCSEQTARLRARGRCRPRRSRIVRRHLAHTGACGDRPRSEPEGRRSDRRASFGSRCRGPHVSGADLWSSRGSLPQRAAGRSAIQGDLAARSSRDRSGSTWQRPSMRSTSPVTATSPLCTDHWAPSSDSCWSSTSG